VAITVGELTWKITGDTRDIDKKLKKTETGLSKFGKMAASAFTAAVIIGFTKKVIDLSVVLVNAASDAEETANKFDVVFDGLENASRAAIGLADGYGLARQESQDLLSSTADLLQGFGVAKDESLDLSLRTQQLAADLASFSNFAGGAQGASQALTSALLGEREAVKALGIAITETELKRFAEQQGYVYDEMTKAEKAVVTLDLAYAQSANSIGDFARSQDSFANQTRIAEAAMSDLRAEMGERLLPASTDITSAFAKVATRLAETVRRSNELREIFDALAGEGVVEDTTEAQRRLREELDALYDGMVRELDIFGRYKEENARVVDESLRQAEAAGYVAREIDGLYYSYQQLTQALNDLIAQENQALTVEEMIALANENRANALIASAEAARVAAEAERELAEARAAAEALALEKDAARKDALLRAAEEEELLYNRKLELIEEKEAASIEAFNAEADAALAILVGRQELDEGIAELDRLAAERQTELREQRIADEEAITKKIKDETLERIGVASNYASSVAQLFGNLFMAITAGDKEMTEQRKKSALALFYIQKAASLAQIGIDTAAAIVKALPNLLLAALVGAIGATQAAVVIATPAPKLAEGGIVPATPGGRTVIVGEGGKDEAIIPLDKAGMTGDMRITVNLDGRPILDAVQSGLNRRQIVVNQGSIA